VLPYQIACTSVAPWSCRRGRLVQWELQEEVHVQSSKAHPEGHLELEYSQEKRPSREVLVAATLVERTVRELSQGR
jgi:hypothetical protein